MTMKVGCCEGRVLRDEIPTCVLTNNLFMEEGALRFLRLLERRRSGEGGPPRGEADRS